MNRKDFLQTIAGTAAVSSLAHEVLAPLICSRLLDSSRTKFFLGPLRL